MKPKVQKMVTEVRGDFASLMDQAVTGSRIDLGHHNHYDCNVRVGPFGAAIIAERIKTISNYPKPDSYLRHFRVVNFDGSEKSLGKHKMSGWDASSFGIVLCRDNSFFLVQEDGKEVSLGKHKFDSWHISAFGVVIIRATRFFLVKKNGKEYSLGKHEFIPQNSRGESFDGVRISKYGIIIRKQNKEFFFIRPDGTESLMAFEQCRIHPWCAAPDCTVTYSGHDYYFVEEDGTQVWMGEFSGYGVISSPHGAVMYNYDGGDFWLVVKK